MKILSDFVVKLLTRCPGARWSPIPLRLIVGYGFMQHGFAKLSRGPDAFIAILQAMGVPVPHFMAWLTILTELIGGLAVLLIRIGLLQLLQAGGGDLDQLDQPLFERRLAISIDLVQTIVRVAA